MILNRLFQILMVASFTVFSSATFAAKKKQTPVKASSEQKKSGEEWNSACNDLLKNSIKSTLALEKSIAKQKKKISRAEIDEKVQNELLVVQLNAWVCAVSTRDQLGDVVQEQFLKEYAEKVQQKRKL